MADDWKKEYDNRQYNLISEQLYFFKREKLSLGNLIARLKGLLEVLEMPDMEWKNKFRSEWWELEQIYVTAANKKEQGLIKDVQISIEETQNQILINRAVKNMEVLLTEKLSISEG